MFKRLLVISIVTFSIVAFSSFAWASVEGTWDVQGKMTVKVSVKGYSHTEKSDFSDELTFDGDGAFDMTDMSGSWSQKKKSFVVKLDPEDISQYFEDAISDEIGTDVTVEVTKISFTGTEQKNGTIKGTLKINMKLYVDDNDFLTGKVAVTTTFKGTRAEVAGMSSVKEKESSQSGSVLDVIEEEVNNSLQNVF
ncbi:MAG: hypothetical protein WC769_04125 [Thermodesulfovibrionales bacterium]|jgi:hypothetical protein